MSFPRVAFSRVAAVAEGQVDPTDDQFSGLPLIAPNHIESGSGRLLAIETAEDQGAISGKYLCEEGDILYSKIRPHLAKVAIAPTRCLTSADMYPISPGPALDAGFLKLYLLSDEFTSAAVLESERVAMPKINRDRLGAVRVPLPKLAEQRRIAAFLDAETERIDQLIATRTRMIESCVELRTSITYEAVAGLLDRRSDRSESSIPWLASRPSHWKEASVRLVAELGSGHTPSRSHPEWWVDCTVPWVTTGEVARLRSDRHEWIYETRENVSELGLANSSAVVHPAGTVVLCRTSASAGYSGIMGSDMATSQDFATWTCGPLLRPRFLLLCLRAMRRDLLERLGQGSTHVTVYMPDIESIRVPLPPVEEQDEIADEAWRRMNALIETEGLLAEQVDLLAERRRALITAAVTGDMSIP